MSSYDFMCLCYSKTFTLVITRQADKQAVGTHTTCMQLFSLNASLPVGLRKSAWCRKCSKNRSYPPGGKQEDSPSESVGSRPALLFMTELRAHRSILLFVFSPFRKQAESEGLVIPNQAAGFFFWLFVHFLLYIFHMTECEK